MGSNNVRKQEKILERVLKEWDNVNFLCKAGEEYIKASEEIAKKEFNSWKKSVNVWIR